MDHVADHVGWIIFSVTPVEITLWPGKQSLGGTHSANMVNSGLSININISINRSKTIRPSRHKYICEQNCKSKCKQHREM